MNNITKNNKKNQVVRFIDYVYSLDLKEKQKYEISQKYIEDVKLILENYGLVKPKEQV